MIKTLKIILIPNNKQKSKLFKSAGVARFAYNWALGREQENYKNGGNFLSDYDLRKEFTKLKSTEEYKWLNDYSNNITKQAIKDACLAYKRFFKGQSSFPKFKSKRKSKPSFYMDTDKIQFTDKTVKLEKITLSRKKNKQKLNWIRLAERNKIPTDTKYINPRITFDGINWWLSVGIEYADNTEIPVNDGVGIDLGIKDLAICSDIDKPYKNLTNIRHNYLHQVTTEIINRKPKFIVLEDLNVKGMMKNKHLSEAIAEQCFYEFYRQIEYKSLWNNIKFIIADRFYASSKICSCCKAVKKDLKLSDRIYKCDNCNTVIDRDKNASINLYNYGKSIA